MRQAPEPDGRIELDDEPGPPPHRACDRSSDDVGDLSDARQACPMSADDSRTIPAPPAIARSGAGDALRRVLPLVLFGLVPVAVTCSMLAIAAVDGPLAWDFHNELYPQAEALLDGRNPYPDALWPPSATAVAMPFTALPPDVADFVFAVAGLACFLAALAVVGVRDWRVYGVALLWPSVIGEIRLSHLTPLLCLLLALAWRTRDSTARAGSALGIAMGLKFFLWPIVLWLAATRRLGAAALAAAIAGASLLLVLPFAGLGDYLSTVADTGRAFDQDGYSVFGLLTQLGAGDAAARTADGRSRRRPARRHLASAEPRCRGRRGARPLAHRLARLLRARRDPARNRPAAAVADLAAAARHVGSPELRDRDRRDLGRRTGARRLRSRPARRCSGRAGRGRRPPRGAA